MGNNKITEGIYSVGVINPNLRVFDIVMRTEFGTTYNSYLVQGSEKTALVETCHKTYFPYYLENIKSICDPEKIDYIILNHNEPDHSGSLAKLLEFIPNATVVVSQAGSIYIKQITNLPDLKIQVVKDGDTLDLGGRNIRFINAPFLHWPDSMFSWVEDAKTLFSCDFLGAHYCEPHLFDYNIAYPQSYESAFKNYYNAIFGPFKPYVMKGLEKIKDLDIDFLCPSHGPVITKKCRLYYVKKMYEDWSRPQEKEQLSIPIFYTTAYGNTGLVAHAIMEGIHEVLPDARVTLYDIIDHNMAQLAQELNDSDAFAIGSPTINKDAVPPTWELLARVDAINNQKKPCLVFGSFGWSGEAVPAMAARLQSLRLKVFGDGFKVTFVPSEADLAEAKKLGSEFARSFAQ